MLGKVITDNNLAQVKPFFLVMKQLNMLHRKLGHLSDVVLKQMVSNGNNTSVMNTVLQFSFV